MKSHTVVRMSNWSTRVHYADTDAGGAAHHMTYLRWFEAARCEWMDSVGLGSRALAGGFGLALAVVKADITYRRPADLDDLLTLQGEAALNGRMTVDVSQTISRGEVTLVEARIKLACVDLRTRKLSPVPPGFHAVFHDPASDHAPHA